MLGKVAICASARDIVIRAYNDDDLDPPSFQGTTTVSEVAMRQGFVELGRFSHDYRIMFGEYPSQTLSGGMIPELAQTAQAADVIEKAPRDVAYCSW